MQNACRNLYFSHKNAREGGLKNVRELSLFEAKTSVVSAAPRLNFFHAAALPAHSTPVAHVAAMRSNLAV